MTNEEFNDLKQQLQQKIIELEVLQKKYSKETGKRYVPPIFQSQPKKATS